MRINWVRWISSDSGQLWAGRIISFSRSSVTIEAKSFPELHQCCCSAPVRQWRICIHVFLKPFHAQFEDIHTENVMGMIMFPYFPTSPFVFFLIHRAVGSVSSTLTPPSTPVSLVLLSAPGWLAPPPAPGRLAPPPAPGWVMHLVPSVTSEPKETQLSVSVCDGQQHSPVFNGFIYSLILDFTSLRQQDFCCCCSCSRFLCHHPAFLHSFAQVSFFKLKFRSLKAKKSSLPQFSAESYSSFLSL